MTKSNQSPPDFPTDYKSILARLKKIKPLKYAGTRNFVDGDVTHLSPYISRGVISLKQVRDQALKKMISRTFTSSSRNWHGVNIGNASGNRKVTQYLTILNISRTMFNTRRW